jgi:hypothetical protein
VRSARAVRRDPARIQLGCTLNVHRAATRDKGVPGKSAPRADCLEASDPRTGVVNFWW